MNDSADRPIRVRPIGLWEAFRMFNVDCAPHIDWKRSSRSKQYDEKYCFNDIKVPLWKFVKRKLSRGEKNAQQPNDNIRSSVSKHPPGSAGRVEDLARFYSGVDADSEGESAFTV